MGLTGELARLLKDSLQLSATVERLSESQTRLSDKVDGLGDRVLKLETRLDTYVEIAQIHSTSPQ